MSSAGLPQWRLQGVSFTQTFQFEFVEFSGVKSTLSFFSTLFFLAFLVYLRRSFISSSIHDWFVVSVPPSSYGCTWKFARFSSVWQLPKCILNLLWRTTVTAKSIWSWQNHIYHVTRMTSCWLVKPGSHIVVSVVFVVRKKFIGQI